MQHEGFGNLTLFVKYFASVVVHEVNLYLTADNPNQCKLNLIIDFFSHKNIKYDNVLLCIVVTKAVQITNKI